MRLIRTVKTSFATIFIALISFPILGCATNPDYVQHNQKHGHIPMYGQPEIQRSPEMQKDDQEFIERASKGFGGDREKACKAWMLAGEDFRMKGNLHYAMLRYNQAWLLDPNSHYPYHGFGQIMLMQRKVDDSIKYYEKAKQLVNDPYQKPAVFTDTAIAYSYKAQSIPTGNKNERSRYFSIANNHFNEASEMDATYTEVWRRWAYSLYEEGKYAEAWEKVKKARSVNAGPTNLFIQYLNSKMPDPK